MLSSLHCGCRVKERLVAPRHDGAFIHGDISVRGCVSPVKGRKGGGGVQVLVFIIVDAKKNKKETSTICVWRDKLSVQVNVTAEAASFNLGCMIIIGQINITAASEIMSYRYD